MKTLEEVYAAIPKVDCQRKCSDQCTAAPMHVIELRRLTKRIKLPHLRYVDAPELYVLQRTEEGKCPALFFQRECAVYSSRPIVCRLFGVTEGLMCKHGCAPERTLTREEAHDLIEAIHRIGGDR